MQTLEERAAARRKMATVKKVGLHSDNHHSFHPHLSVEKSWELLAKLSQEAWIEKTGQIPSSRVDKSTFKFISLSSKI